MDWVITSTNISLNDPRSFDAIEPVYADVYASTKIDTGQMRNSIKNKKIDKKKYNTISFYTINE